VVSLTVGFVYDFVCRKVEEKAYPLNFTEYVEMNAEYYGVPKDIIYSVIKVESNYTQTAVSSKGAVGLMQMMPDTFEWLLTKTGEEHSMDKLNDPAVNIKYGTYYLSMLYDELAVWDNVYAAYNAGIGNVRKWLKDSQYTTNGRLTNIPFNETSKYVVKVNEARDMYNKLYFE
jgi:Soluble lytic murein transglycosylase and related regulatory proteins (some contain LysM/invasin domains)